MCNTNFQSRELFWLVLEPVDEGSLGVHLDVAEQHAHVDAALCGHGLVLCLWVGEGITSERIQHSAT